MAEEKRVKLGIDIGELSNQLLQVNNLVEENYNKAIQGQTEYNRILSESIELLKEQVDLIGQFNSQNIIIGGENNNNNNSNINNSLSESDIRKYILLIDRIRGTMGNDSSNNINDNQNNNIEDQEDLLRNILEDLDNIWEKFAEGIKIEDIVPVEVKNVPLLVRIDNNGGNGGGNFNNNSNSGNNLGNSSNRRGNTGNTISTVSDYTAQAVTTKDWNFLLPSLVSVIPWVGVGLGSVFSSLMQEAENLDFAQHNFRATTGREGYNLGNFNNIGLSQAEALQKQTAYYSNNIYLNRRDLEFEKGFNISSGTLGALLGSLRQDMFSNFGASVLGVNYLNELIQNNLNKNEVRGYSEEYLKILIDINQEQLRTTGKTNTILSSDLIGKIAGLDSRLSDPNILSRVISGLQNGLVQANSPQIEALQYYALSKTNPNASIWEMQLMKENPFGEQSRGYLSNFLEGLFSTGNIDDIKFNIMKTFGLTAHQTEYLVEGIKKAKEENALQYRDEAGNFDLQKYLENNNIQKNLFGAEKQISFEASMSTSAIQKMVSENTDRMANWGMPIIETTTEAINSMGAFFDKLPNYFNEASDWIEDFGGKFKEKMEEVVDGLKPSWLGGNSSKSTVLPKINNVNPYEDNLYE